MTYLIINADDFGLSKGITDGIVDAHRYGIVTSTTLMANMPATAYAAGLANLYPDLGIGVHLTLTAGKPLLKTHQTLTDAEGNFHKLSFYQDETFTIDNKELFEEWDAQIKRIIELGVTPTHLDSHHHVHALGKNREVIEALGRKYDIPVRKNYNLPDDIRSTKRIDLHFDTCGDIHPTMLQPYLDNIIDDCLTYESLELICHPGYLDRYVLEHSSLTDQRTRTLDFVINSDFSKQIKNHDKIKLVNFSVIK
ncbi:carbohydrate deacetylase [Erysipelothrix inopinata]|uniref:Carbohydrate deacetylase n=1 Tax=Erysipelothrix inopinata TaxID=225084 RepID=A0A7G9RW62_9FIRM|nr:carbohydrate deacetylase [Erysipelothrix inopinata]QNN59837.1 carbohydrate deacetylase [Erysipelothrix inopinata]